MDIRIQPASPDRLRPKPDDENALGFGKYYGDHMFTVRWTPDGGWADPTVKPFEDFSMSPAALVLHYGQTIFEGLKAYRNPRGTVNLFRPLDNAERFNRSAARLDLPTVDPKLFLSAIEALIELDHEWVPHTHGTSLYVRPTMIATEPYIGLKSTHEATFFIITSPVGAYYPEGFNPVKILVCEEYARAGKGGLGAAKTGANYAASLKAEKDAYAKGFTQVLWLDAAEGHYIEEVGSMNILFKIGGTVITPPPSETILDGITKRSVLEMLKSWDIPVSEERLTIDEVLDAQREGTLEEVFGAGTAAVISPVGALGYRDETHYIANGGTGPIAERLFEELTGLQYGTHPDPFGWVHEVAPAGMRANAASSAADD